MKDKLLKIISFYGIDKQLKYIHSEYFELDEAIMDAEKFKPKSFTQIGINLENYTNHVAEELADVMVMLKQIQYYYDIKDEEIKKIMEKKVNRQLDRIEKEKMMRK